jgi:hypothetical protein
MAATAKALFPWEHFMTIEEMKEKARTRVEQNNPGSNEFKPTRIFENIMNGTLVTVTFMTQAGKEDSNHVHFGPDEMRVYRWHGDVLADVSGSRERVWFFRFIELAGIGGVIAFVLVIAFSIMLCVLAFVPSTNSTVLEVIKASFTLILGFFFGSQSAGKKSA